jgi:hypothetical protein
MNCQVYREKPDFGMKRTLFRPKVPWPRMGSQERRPLAHQASIVVLGSSTQNGHFRQPGDHRPIHGALDLLVFGFSFAGS